jgi:hypothetical protein
MLLVARHLAAVVMIAFVTTPALATQDDPTKVAFGDRGLVVGCSTCATPAPPHVPPSALSAIVPREPGGGGTWSATSEKGDR